MKVLYIARVFYTHPEASKLRIVYLRAYMSACSVLVRKSMFIMNLLLMNYYFVSFFEMLVLYLNIFNNTQLSIDFDINFYVEYVGKVLYKIKRAMLVGVLCC